LFHLPYGVMLKAAGSELMSDSSRPNVVRYICLLLVMTHYTMLRETGYDRWWNDITNRPSWLAVKDGEITPDV
jgi:hypothetical protein